MSEQTNDIQTTAGTLRAERGDVAGEQGGRDRPDQRAPRGNPDIESIDVERGREKLDRVLGQ